MTWIKMIEPLDAEGKLKDLYDQVQTPEGHVDNILKIHSLRPRTLQAHLFLYKSALHSKPNGLTIRERELIGVYVSKLNGCQYCVQHHRAGLAREIGDEALAAQLTREVAGEDPPQNLSDREREMIAYTTKLTRTPAEMESDDIDNLRGIGLDDAAILDLNQIVAYFAYANRTVQGLGVEVAGEPLGLHPDENKQGFQHK